MKTAWAATILALAACAPAAVPHGQSEVEWILVQRPGAIAAFVAVADEPVLRTRLLTESAAVGAPAEMEIWCEQARAPVAVKLVPSRSGIRVLGPVDVTIAPGQRVRVRFTSDSPGRGTVLAVPAERGGVE